MGYGLMVRNAGGAGVHLFLDDIRIDTFRGPGTKTYPLPAGPHLVYCRRIGRTSEVLRIEARKGETVRLACSPGWRGNFLSGDPQNVRVVLPARRDPNGWLIPGLLLVNTLALALKGSTLTAEEWRNFPLLPAAALALASLALSAGLGVWVARRLARIPKNTGARLRSES